MRIIFLLLLIASIFNVLTGSAFSGENFYDQKRREMVEKDLKARGIKDEKVINAMLKVKRHLFVDKKYLDKAYEDHPLPIGEGQTISQPYVVALMTEALSLKGDERVLEIGTGSGYQAAILGEIVKEVYTVEIRKGLYEKAKERLKNLGYSNIFVKYGDGYYGWERHSPFDAIIVTASANHIPPPLLKQLKNGGRLIIPLGSTVFYQNLTLVHKDKDTFRVKELGHVLFVPMIGEVSKR
ncbi:MAG: protein-L-isoaspartate(D-aspartate) O-methyltransferase [Deltaproteobacteria bacterium]|nr:protein-L-isoaspartate(D-aspartate) O-methyltransferase [Deltaproteobacteria bacterium]